MNNRRYRVVKWRGKRLFDFFIASMSLCLLLPAIFIIIFIIRLTMGKPAFFRQARPGAFGRPFTLYKFRTMTDERGHDGTVLVDRDRLTPIGKMLRSTSLDELPELWNVIRGEMSLVGPRPLLFRYLPYFKEREMLRLHALPGITGLAQVSGRNLIGWDERLELDARYVEKQSLRLDVSILVRTLMSVLKREGVSADVDLVETWLDEERSEESSNRIFSNLL
ncbi:sugar transferase [Acidobacteriota bacterium]